MLFLTQLFDLILAVEPNLAMTNILSTIHMSYGVTNGSGNTCGLQKKWIFPLLGRVGLIRVALQKLL